MKMLSKLEILSPNDVDIVSRIHDYTSRSIHIGTSFDRVVAWYLSFYLTDMKFESTKIESLLRDLLNNYKVNNKFKIVSNEDKVTDYSRFQKPSNQKREIGSID